jgi:pimeloyl-ACP methyl ester carboxylesterase
MSKRFVNPAEFIMPININGMDGRMLRVDSHNRHNRREILVIYDMQSNLEKWWGLAVALKSYANVTLIDLPGLGGMDSFYSIGRKPNLDNMADYIASFIKLKYKRKSLSIIAIGFGFTLVTRMLQNNPDIENKVHSVICINGYSHKDDFNIKNSDRRIMKVYSFICSTKPVSDILRLTLNNTPMLKLKYPLSKIKGTRKGPSKEFIRQFKIDLVKATDLRTKMHLNLELLNLDNCKIRINKPLWHITTSNSDQNVDLKLVEQHFRVIFDSYHHLPTKISGAMPLVMNDEKVAIKYLPAKVRRLLKTQA